MENFISGPRGDYNLRFIRRMYSRWSASEGKGVLCADLDDGQAVELFGISPPASVNQTIISGYGTARVVHWSREREPSEPDKVSADCLSWYTTRIIGWRIDIDDEDMEPWPILVDPAASNGAYAIEEPDGQFTVPGDCRLLESDLNEWALGLARAAAMDERHRRGRETATADKRKGEGK